jgi:hypothetical protein
MVATPINVNTITRAGSAPVTEAAGDNTNGNSFPNNGATWLEVTNGGGSAATITVSYPNKVDGQTVPVKSFSLAAAAKSRIGPFPPAIYGNTVTVTPSAATVTVAAYQLGS